MTVVFIGKLLLIQRRRFIIGFIVWCTDSQLASHRPEDRVKLLAELNETLIVNEIGLLQWLLGISFKYRADGLIFASQELLMKDLLDNFASGIHKDEVRSTPLMPDLKLSKADCPEIGSDEYKECSKFGMRSAVGMMMYLLNTREDIKYAIGQLAKFVANPGKVHIDAWQVDWRWT